MNKWILSKQVRAGDIVAMRGSKVIRCGRRNRPMGVYQQEQQVNILSLDHISHLVTLPTGVVCYGPTVVRGISR